MARTHEAGDYGAARVSIPAGAARVVDTAHQGLFQNEPMAAARQEATDRADRRAAHPSEPAGPVLQVESVCKQFGTRSLLKDVSLRLRHREVLALCGTSGCGKTTLLRIISGLSRFDSGRLIIGAETIAADPPYPAHLYGKIGMIFQEHNLFPHMTAIANVTLALRKVRRLPPREAHDRGMAELERMGVASLAERYPATFSGGERRRVAIARALAMDPLLLLLDEPTAHLDSDRVHEVCERVLELASAGTTMLLVTHNIEFAREAANTYAVLQNGMCCLSDDSFILDRLRHQRR
jgi:ABC-type polar amino acid transport system ATPase subunit